MADHLTIQREGFIQDLLKGESQRTAYKNNYSCKNMKDKTIDEAASRLLKNSKVNARYNELKDKVVQELEKECIITVKEVLKDYIEIKQACMQRVDITEYNKDTEEAEVIGSKLVDAQSALKANDSLGKYLKMFTDKIELTEKVVVVGDIDE